MSRSAWISGGMSFLGKIITTPSRLVSLSTSTRNPDHAGFLDPPDRPDHPYEVRVRRSAPASGPAVGEPVYGLERDGQQDVGPVARLEQLHQPDGRDGSHQGPDEAGPGQRHVGDGGPVGVLTLGAQADAAVGHTRDDAAEVEDAPGGGERALQLVAADDLPHVHEDRSVGIAQLDDVEEHLLLPGAGHRRGVVEPVAVERHRSVARAAGEARRAHEGTDPRGNGMGHAAGRGSTRLAHVSVCGFEPRPRFGRAGGGSTSVKPAILPSSSDLLGRGRREQCMARAMIPVQPVWWLAPRPAPLSPWKYS